MFRFEKQRLLARRKLLNSKYITNFDKVPDFIINTFFGECDYKSRLLIVTFCVLNGISPYQCLLLCHLKSVSKVKLEKIEKLYKYLKKQENRSKYYSYCVFFDKVFYLNGDLRLHQTRVINHKIFKRE